MLHPLQRPLYANTLLCVDTAIDETTSNKQQGPGNKRQATGNEQRRAKRERIQAWRWVSAPRASSPRGRGYQVEPRCSRLPGYASRHGPGKEPLGKPSALPVLCCLPPSVRTKQDNHRSTKRSRLKGGGGEGERARGKGWLSRGYRAWGRSVPRAAAVEPSPTQKTAFPSRSHLLRKRSNASGGA